MARNPEYDVTLDGVGLILTRDGLGVSRVQANPYAMKSSTGERTYADLDEWAVFQVSSCHRGMGQERYGDPEQLWYAHGTDTRFKDKIICSPAWQDVDSANMTGASDEGMFFVRFDEKLFCASDDEVFELVSGSWTSRDEVAGEDVSGMVAFNEYLYVARGYTNSMRKSADGTDWTDVGDTPKATHLYVHGGFLYRSYVKTVLYSSDPEADSPIWSTAISIGDTTPINSIKSMCTYQNSLIVFKADGAWRIPGNPGDLDKAYRVPELDWRAAVHINNGKYSCVWSDGFLYVSNGDAGLLRWTGRTVTPIGPDTLLANDITGTLVGLIPTPNFLYTTLSNAGDGAESYILAWNGSGWHCLKYMLHTNSNALYFFDGELYWGAYTAHTTDESVVWKIYNPAKTQDPTQDTSYTYQADNYLWLPKFTANLHHTYKEFRSLTFWLDNLGGTATSGAQTVTWGYSVDRNSGTADAGVLTVKADGQKTFTVDFDAPDFTDKVLASVDTDRQVVTLATGHGVSDIDTGDWLYFADINEYRYVHSKTTGPPATLTLQCALDNTPAANTYIRPGVPVGRYILIKLTLSTADSARTPVVYATALKYLVNISDYDIWQLNVQVSDPVTLRNGNIKRQPIADQLERLNEIRKKGRVAFVDEVGDSHTVKITNYSLQPVKQRTDERSEPIASYACKMTLLEV